MADLATVERRQAKVRTMAKAQPREFAPELDLLERLTTHLAKGQLARMLRTSLTEKEALLCDELNLLTAKPRLFVANVNEAHLPDGGPLADQVRYCAQAQGTECIVVCASCEADLAGWTEEEAAEYRASLGLASSGLEQLVQASYRLLDLITFFTATGTNVVRAWTLKRGQSAYEAAGKIHTDMQRGFVRAEVISFDDLMAAGDLGHARERGLIRLEGREYLVQDGDVLHFRFTPPR
jgi:hypothetical protein